MKTDLLCAISGYGMVTGASVLLAAFLLFFISKKRGLYEDFAFEALLFVIIPALLFARLYYVTFDFAANGTHWTAGMFFGVNTTNSSLSAFGAIIGGFLGICALYAFNRYLFDKDPDKYAYRNVTLSQLCDAAFVAAIFALGVGRWGDLIDNRSMGTIVGNDALKWFPMAVKTGENWYYAIFFYEFLWDAVTFAVMLAAYIGKKKSYDGFVSCLFMLMYGLGRVATDGVRVGTLWLIEDVIRVDQMFGAAFIVFGLVLFITYLFGARSAGKQLFLFVPDSELTNEYYGAKTSRVNKPSLESFKAKKSKIQFADEDNQEDNDRGIGDDDCVHSASGSDRSADQNSYGDDAKEE